MNSKSFFGFLVLVALIGVPFVASAHRSGCHRWHSCPSDTGSYVCGDLGYTSGCPIVSNPPVVSRIPDVKIPPTTRPASSPSTAVATSTVITKKTILKKGMSGSEVSALQRVLAKDPSIYPEGTITGYFGAATVRAVIRFQKKNGLEPTGSVGPKTRALLNI